MESKKAKLFDDLISMGHVTKTFKVGAHEIKMRSLGYEEQSKIVAGVPDVEQTQNGDQPVKESRRYDIIQKELLAASIEEIDGMALSGEEKAELLAKSQTAFVNLLFAQYEQLLESQSGIIEDVKKNISSAIETH